MYFIGWSQGIGCGKVNGNYSRYLPRYLLSGEARVPWVGWLYSCFQFKLILVVCTPRLGQSRATLDTPPTPTPTPHPRAPPQPVSPILHAQPEDTQCARRSTIISRLLASPKLDPTRKSPLSDRIPRQVETETGSRGMSDDGNDGHDGAMSLGTWNGNHSIL
jgi:hypothetical protein